MAGKTLSVTIPQWTANLLPNLLGLLGLVAVCYAIAALTDFRWGILAGGVFAVVLAVWISPAAVPAAEAGNVRSLKQAA